MKKAYGYYIIVIEDEDQGKIVGAGTLFIEMKFLRNCGKVNLFTMLFQINKFRLVKYLFII